MLMKKSVMHFALLPVVWFLFSCRPHRLASGLSLPSRSLANPSIADISTSRRRMLGQFLAVGASAAVASAPLPALAAPDCVTDCLKNCRKIAPKDPDYCTMNCHDYCAQEDRTDGLSGSVSAANGEVGILGGSFGQGTVPKGEDKPPSISLPGLDFSSKEGRKLLGYQ